MRIGQVSGDPVPPEGRGVEDVRGVEAAARGEGPVGAEHARRELLEEARVLGGEAEVPHGDLRVRAREREGAHGRGRIVVLLREREGGSPGSPRRPS